MQFTSYPFSFLVVSIAGWMNQHQQQVIEFLMEENRVLREQMGTRRMRFSDDQRRRLAVKAKQLGRKLLSQAATIVTPETLLAWHRKLIAKKYDGSLFRTPGRPHTATEITTLVIRMSLGLPSHPGSTGQSGSCAGTQNDCEYSETARDRTGARAKPKNNVERVSQQTF